jgi:sulfatase maturation enzyme AslB (radical SAM superfamily)
VTSLHFKPLTDHGLAREAFRQAIRWIEIETSSPCNRRCSYCPNSKFGRISRNDFLDRNVYQKMIREMAKIHYGGDIKFVGNNEFFMPPTNRLYVQYARNYIPKCHITLFSNGNYLKTGGIEWAARNQVERLVVTHHPGPTKHYDDVELLRRASLFQAQTGLPMQQRHFKQK